jgi:DNA-binding MarR family transcriptional regulator
VVAAEHTVGFGDDLDEVARLRAVLLRLGRRLRAIDAGSGLTPAELSVVGATVRWGPIRPSELARREGLNPTMLSRILARLVDDGTLCRQDDPADGRVALVSVTTSGRRLHRQIRAARAQVLHEHIGRLPTSQQRAISAALPALESLVELLDGGRR